MIVIFLCLRVPKDRLHACPKVYLMSLEMAFVGVNGSQEKAEPNLSPASWYISLSKPPPSSQVVKMARGQGPKEGGGSHSDKNCFLAECQGSL